ncbi:hypothetical protein J3F83DRAFT_237480 [Trichoderma novae-zelandiae]
MQLLTPGTLHIESPNQSNPSSFFHKMRSLADPSSDSLIPQTGQGRLRHPERNRARWPGRTVSLIERGQGGKGPLWRKMSSGFAAISGIVEVAACYVHALGSSICFTVKKVLLSVFVIVQVWWCGWLSKGAD